MVRRPSTSRSLLVLVAAALLVAPLRAGAVLLVPGQFATIQSAVDAATVGDTIAIAPGTYVEDVVVDGKSLWLQGLDGAGATVLQGTGAGPVLTVTDTFVAEVVVEGLTLTGGTGAPDPGAPGLTRGGGLLCLASRTRVRDCRIIDNHVSGDGGGVAAIWAAAGLTLEMERCLVADNSAGRDGGGVRGDHGGVSLLDCTLQRNEAGRDGGGLSTRTAGSEARGTLFVENQAARHGGGISLRSPEALGLALLEFEALDNVAGGDGGGVHVVMRFADGFLVPARISHQDFVGNVAGGRGGGLFLDAAEAYAGPPDQPPIRIERCNISLNQAAVAGGGVWAGVTTDELAPVAVHVDASTFQQNLAPAAPALALEAAVPVALDVEDTILWEHPGPAVTSTVGATFTRCDVEGGAPGIDNYDADPRFVDADRGVVALLPDSPCLPLVTTTPGTGAETFSWSARRPPALHGSGGRPELTTTGSTLPSATLGVHVERAASLAPAWFVIGGALAEAPFKGGVFFPAADIVLPGLLTSGAGEIAFDITVPVLPPGFQIHWQVWIQDAFGPAGFAASNGLTVVAP